MGQAGRITGVLILGAAIVVVAVLVVKKRETLWVDTDGRADAQREASEIPVTGQSASETASSRGFSDSGRLASQPIKPGPSDAAAATHQSSSVNTDQLRAFKQSDVSSIPVEVGPGDGEQESRVASGELDLTGPGGGSGEVAVSGPGPGDPYDPDDKFDVGPGANDIPIGERGPGDGTPDLDGPGPGEAGPTF